MLFKKCGQIFATNYCEDFLYKFNLRAIWAQTYQYSGLVSEEDTCVIVQGLDTVDKLYHLATRRRLEKENMLVLKPWQTVNYSNATIRLLSAITLEGGIAWANGGIE